MSKEICVRLEIELEASREVLTALRARARQMGIGTYQYQVCEKVGDILEDAIHEAFKEQAWQNTVKKESGKGVKSGDK